MCTGNRCSCVSAAPNLVRKAGAAAVRGHTSEGVLALMWPANACRWWRPAAALACMRRACALIVHPCPVHLSVRCRGTTPTIRWPSSVWRCCRYVAHGNLFVSNYWLRSNFQAWAVRQSASQKGEEHVVGTCATSSLRALLCARPDRTPAHCRHPSAPVHLARPCPLPPHAHCRATPAGPMSAKWYLPSGSSSGWRPPAERGGACKRRSATRAEQPSCSSCGCCGCGAGQHSTQRLMPLLHARCTI